MKTKFTSLLFIFILGNFTFCFAQEQDAALNAMIKFWRNAYNNPQTSSLHKTITPDDAASAVDFTLLAKALPDEDYFGIGHPDNNFDPTLTEFEGIPKTNQAYVWGFVKDGPNIWFGTAPNVLCLVEAGFLGFTGGHEVDNCWVCEGHYTWDTYPDAIFYDWRPPRIFMYNTAADVLEEKTGLLDELGRTRLNHTLGIRSAGAFNGVVFVGGPNTGGLGPTTTGAQLEVDGIDGGINLFAFNANTGEYLGSTTIDWLGEFGSMGYADNIRKWVVANGVLYCGLGVNSGYDLNNSFVNNLGQDLNKSVDQTDVTTPGGAIMRWRGNVDDPFQFEVVGEIASDAAEIIQHNGRLYVNTWPNIAGPSHFPAGIWRSPIIPADGLTDADKHFWNMVWNVLQYEPDPVVAMTYGGGAMASYDGKLYWGTMHVPFVAGIAVNRVYGEYWSPIERLIGILGAHRSIAIFRGNFDVVPSSSMAKSSDNTKGAYFGDVELLYGNPFLPRYVGVTDVSEESDKSEETPTVGGWMFVPNNMHSLPLFGLSGINNFFNNYTWAMDVYKNRLYVGTMDWSFLAFAPLMSLIPELPEGIQDIINQLGLTKYLGADLWKFTSSSFPAVPVSVGGLGNNLNYGVRNLLSDGTALYAGMANPMNLSPKGGWELIRVDGRPGAESTSSTMFLITPNGGEIYMPGTTRNIVWALGGVTPTVPVASTSESVTLSKNSGSSNTAATSVYVKIEFSTNNGATWNLIKSRYLGNNLSYPWLIPNTPSTQCLVRVTKFGESGNYVVSNDVFTIGTNIIGQIAVWPGDADNDGDVDQYDFNAIKEYENMNGTPRLNASTTWIAQPATPWTPVAATYADCNGDGVINSDDFYVVLNVNWGKTHAALGKSNVNIDAFALRQNFPNPFNPSTQIQFELPENSSVSLKIYSMLGEEVASLINDQDYVSGIHQVEFRPENLSSGIYVYRFFAKSHESNKEFSMVKKLQYLR
ncbi:MAG: T9SS C-terminal target domain-containing protein [Ignavibacteriales bacterium]|nr:MAG: T9SS C-terminal target domain-containing protein [Ignavibacteriales bacterium]